MTMKRAIDAANEQNDEVDRIAADLIRQKGIALWPAIEEAGRRVRERRKFSNSRSLRQWISTYSEPNP